MYVFFSVDVPRSSVLSPGVEKVVTLHVFLHGLKTNVGLSKKKFGRGRPANHRFSLLCVFVVRLAALSPFGFNKQCLKNTCCCKLTQNPMCSHACIRLQHLKLFQSFVVIFFSFFFLNIRAVSLIFSSFFLMLYIISVSFAIFI